ncbi:ABC transporter ATP-binding protein [Actinoallomurus acaciae]|uniref:ABC transporter ATP-binding protein n=1 Tax=Actinoallomurus acaciae TaxID=502577 RepID=A0ABV5YI31_9ACTN
MTGATTDASPAGGSGSRSAGRVLLPVATGRQVRAYLRRVMRGRRPLLCATAVTMIAESLLGLVGPVAIGWITQAIADHRGVGVLVGPVVLLATSTVAGAAAGWGSTVLLARTVLPAVARLREETVAAAVELPIDVVEAGGAGDLVSRVSGDAELVSDAASDALGSFIGSGLAILAALAGLAALDWRFALAGLLAVPIQAHTLRWYLRTSRPIYAGGRVADGRRASALLTGFTALSTLRALRLGASQRDRVEAASAESMDYEFRAVRAATRFYGRLNLAEFVGLGAILLVAYFLVRAELVSLGAATTAALFFAGLFGPINIVLGVFDGIQQAGAGLARLVGITTLTGARDAGRPAPGPIGTAASLTAENVSFGYGEGPDVVRDISLRLEPGRQIAVVGTTGSGKSTLASLLAGLRRPRTGTAALDGVFLEYIDLPQHHVALVTQETHVFAGTIADNLRLARPEATREAIDDALHAVGAHDWVEALPDGIETPVGGGGRPLTASQAQQLALARLWLLDPPIVILDEATAEAGSDTARALDHAARQVTRGRSSVVIAHRLGQAAHADIVIVMENGRVGERGGHEELRAAGGVYATLWAAWSQASSGPA